MIQCHPSILDIPPDAWNRIAGPDYPFLRHEFLAALEESESVHPDEGWIPRHITLSDETGRLRAAMPCYEKDHSFGEYVFDWAWADAYHRHRVPYYPKLLTAVPFTPSIGPRLLADPEVTSATVDSIVGALLDNCRMEEISSWHLLFPDRALVAAVESSRIGPQLVARTGVQYHWYNQGDDSFDAYLQRMTSRKRKSIRRERAQVADQGITFRHVTGSAITPDELDDFYLFYHATYMKRGQQGYLNRRFFELLIRDMPESLLFVFAVRQEEAVAAAFFLLGGDTLYGRYWGCLEEYRQLHFETCYYQGIDYCLRHGLTHFDAGAQGEHKIQRGFEPCPTHSYHWIAHPEFRRAIADSARREQRQIDAYIADARGYLPFKQQQ